MFAFLLWRCYNTGTRLRKREVPAEGLRAGGACFAVEVIQVRKVQKEIDVIATFRIGEPPEPHRFRIEGLDGERYEYRIGEIRDIRLLNVFGDRVWNYECCGLIGGHMHSYVLQFNLRHATWKMVEVG